LELERLAVLVEGGALQRSAIDQTIFRILIGLGVIDAQILRRAVVGDAAVDQRRRLIPIAAVGRVLAEATSGNALLVIIFAADLDVETAVEEGFAGRGLEQILLVIPIRWP
jgi:hypothetical protein